MLLEMMHACFLFGESLHPALRMGGRGEIVKVNTACLVHLSIPSLSI